MQRILFLTITALLVGAFVGLLLQKEEIYLLLATENISFEMTVWTALFLYLLSILLVVIVILVLTWVLGKKGIRSWLIIRGERKNLESTKKGLIYFIDYDWKKAADTLEKSAKKSLIPSINYIFSAKAAAELEDYERAYSNLGSLKLVDPKADSVSEKIRAELLLREEKFEESIEILNELLKKFPRDSAVNKLLIDCYYLTEKWSELQKSLSHIKKNQVLIASSFELLELETYQNLLKYFKWDKSKHIHEQIEKIDDLWEMIPKHIQIHPSIISQYFDLLDYVDNTEKITPLVIKQIKKSWNHELIRRLGNTKHSAPEKILSVAEKWLFDRPDDPILLECLGNLCINASLLGKAKDYFSAALKIKSSPGLFLKLGKVLSEIGEEEESRLMFERGLEESI